MFQGSEHGLMERHRKRRREPVSLGAASFTRMVAASLILLAVMLVSAVSASADLSSIKSQSVDLVAPSDSSGIALSISAAPHQGGGQKTPGPCGDHRGSYQCCGTHCPCPSASSIPAEATDLVAMRLSSSGRVANQNLPTGSPKFPDERPPRWVDAA